MNRHYVAPLLALSMLAIAACDKKPATEIASRDSSAATTPATTPAANTPVASTPGPAPAVVTPTVGIGQVVSVAKGSPDQVADFSWKGSDGVVHSIKDYRGQVVMVNFWGTWCPPCRHELPDLVKVRAENAAKGMEIIGIAVNEEPTDGMTVDEHLLSFAKENKLEYPIVLANDDLIGAFGDIGAVPTTFIVNREGKIVASLVGAKSAAEFTSALQAAL
jgi:thiol-disulfide isomerase/thioredoxin